MPKTSSSEPRTRRDKGEGSIYQITTGKHAGKWRMKLVYRDLFNRKQEVSRICRTQRDAKTALKEAKDAAEKGVQPTKRTTLSEWFDWLVEHQFPKVHKASTIYYRRCRFDKYVRPQIGQLLLVGITPRHVSRFYDEVVLNGAGASTVTEIKRDLTMIFNKAIELAEVPMDAVNPFSRIKIKTPAPRQKTGLSRLEGVNMIRQLEEHVASGGLDIRALAATAIGLYAGLRRAEVMALRWVDVDFHAGFLLVRQAVSDDGKGKQVIGLPKGGKQRRAVLVPSLGTILKALKETEPDATEFDLCFPSEKRTPLSDKNFSKLFSAAIEKSQLEPEIKASIRFHDLRLTCNNWLDQLCPDVKDTTRKLHMGHSAEGVNQSRYTDELQEAMDRLRQSLEHLITSTEEAQPQVACA
jgi:integrase